MKKPKYIAVACIGDELDFNYEEVGSTNKWKEARELSRLGALIYCDNKKIELLDHSAINSAYADLAIDLIIGLDITSNSAFEADIKREIANKTLKKYGLTADETWKQKILTRYENIVYSSKYTIPFAERNFCVFNAETGKYENGKVEELPF